MPNSPDPTRRRWRLSFIGKHGWILALLLGISRLPTQGFLIQTFDGPSGPVQQHWKDPQRIPFVLHDAGSADLTPELTHRLLRESFQLWEAVPTAMVQFVDQGLTTTGTPSSQDRRNLVYFDETGNYLQAPPGSGIIAITRISANERTGEIVDADILFNGRDFRFAAKEARPPGSIDLKEVAVHEIGHLLGLDHTPLEGPTHIRPVMNPFNWGDGAGESYRLKPDDIAGISSLYPAPGYFASTAAISGQVTDPQNRPVFGAHLVAEALDTTARISTVSGAYPQKAGKGHYFLRGLPPGRYRLALSPIEGTITEDNFGGIFSQFVTGFPTEYYDNVADPERAHIFTLTTGQQVDGIDFITGLARPGYPQAQTIFGPTDTPNTQGPYAVRIQATEVERLWLRYRPDERADPIPVAMNAAAADFFDAQIPGQPAGARIFYQFEARSPADNTAFFPGQQEWLSFAVLQLSGAPLIFTALRDDNAISVIDTGKRGELTRIPVGKEPIQLLLDRDGRLFVTHLLLDQVWVIDTATFQVVERLETESQPLDMALTPDGRTLYITNSGAASLTVVDIASGTTRTLPLPIAVPGPYGIAVTGTQIYVTDINGNQVLVIAPDGSITNRLAVTGQPRSLALAPDGRTLYITSLESNLLTLIDVPQARIRRTIELPVSGTFAVAPSPDGRKIYLTAHLEGALVVVDGQTATVLGVLTTGENPRGLSFSPDGAQLFITNAFSNRITLVDAMADTIMGAYETGPNPRGIALHLPTPPIDDPGDHQLNPRPSTFFLAPNAPNPFNLSTRITYSLSSAQGPTMPVELRIYNILGQPIRTLVDQRQTPGSYLLEWDGTDEKGNLLTSGVYLVVLRADRQQAMQKAVLLR